MNGEVHYQTYERDPLFCKSTMIVMASDSSMAVQWVQTPLDMALAIAPAKPASWSMN